jgi:hypothetical protein
MKEKREMSIFTYIAINMERERNGASVEEGDRVHFDLKSN